MKTFLSVIVLIILSTTSCVDRLAQDDFRSLPPRIDKQEIKSTFSDIPFGSKKEIKVALLLPLSGKHEKLGQSLLKAAELALFDHYDPRIVLYPFDSKGSEFTAISQMQEIIAKDIDVVIGPVFGKVAKAVAPLALENSITILSFSNDTAIASENVYVLGLNVRQQVKRIVSYSADNGIKYFSAILPANEYGSAVAQELRKMSSLYGGMVMKTEFYLPRQKIGKNIRRVRRSLVEIPVNDDGEPLFRKVRPGVAIPTDQDGRPLYQDIEGYKTALLIADGSRKLMEITTLLERNDIASSGAKLIGLSSWDDSAALRSPVYDNAWYVDIPKNNHKLFDKHFDEVYNYSPSDLAAISYDAVSVIAALAARDGDGFSLVHLNNPIGFSGIAGVFRFRDSGVVERLLEVYEVNDGNVETVDPSKFQF